MNRSILIAGGMIAGAILLQPIVTRLVVNQPAICTETGVLQVVAERSSSQKKPIYKGSGAETPRSSGKLYEPRSKGRLYEISAPNEHGRQAQNMSEREIDVCGSRGQEGKKKNCDPAKE